MSVSAGFRLHCTGEAKQSARSHVTTEANKKVGEEKTSKFSRPTSTEAPRCNRRTWPFADETNNNLLRNNVPVWICKWNAHRLVNNRSFADRRNILVHSRSQQAELSGVKLHILACGPENPSFSRFYLYTGSTHSDTHTHTVCIDGGHFSPFKAFVAVTEKKICITYPLPDLALRFQILLNQADLVLSKH